MDKDDDSISRAEALAVLYLVIPLFIFFAFFIRLELAVPACALIAFQVIEIIRRADWRGAIASSWVYLYFFSLAALWLWLSNGPEGLHQNSDWFKHTPLLTTSLKTRGQATSVSAISVMLRCAIR